MVSSLDIWGGASPHVDAHVNAAIKLSLLCVCDSADVLNEICSPADLNGRDRIQLSAATSSCGVAHLIHVALH